MKRNELYKNSDLPYSFMYKIRNAFIGEICPICHRKMGVTENNDGIWLKTPMPTIQHNMPISLGGKHELSNISVVCRSCNTSIQDIPTGKLNNDLVVKKWSEING